MTLADDVSSAKASQREGLALRGGAPRRTPPGLMRALDAVFKR
jgi:hypothetical protein